MKTTSKHPFVITDKNPKLQPFYFTLICGLQNNQLSMVELALKNKADVSKLKLTKDTFDNDDYYDDDDSERDDREYDIVPAMEFAREYCSPAIFQAVMESVKLTPEQKCGIVLKALSEVKKDEDVAINASLQKTLATYVNSKNINQYHKVSNLRRPTSIERQWGDYEKCEATFFHVAVYTTNVSLIKQMMELGSDINLKLKGKEAEGNTVAHIIVRKTPGKGDQTRYVNALIALINAGANLEIKNSDKESGWEAIVSQFKIPELRKIFANHQPTNLATIEMVKSKSRPLMEFWQKQTKGQGFNRYPLINDIFKYEKRQIQLGRDIGGVDNLEKFLGHKSLKKALDQRYGFSSSRLSSVITKHLFSRAQADVVTVKPEILQVADWLKVVFTDNKVLNTSDYLEVLESYNSDESKYDNTLKGVNDDIHHSYRDNGKLIHNLKSVMVKVYTPQQIKSVLMSKDKLEDSVDDIYRMYRKFSKELDIILKRTKFSDVDSLQKLHDFLSGEVETLEQEDFKLEQATVNPKLKSLEKITMSLGYGVKLAESNHELIRWGSQMGHCVGGGDYAEEAKNGDTIIMAITKDNEPKFCIEISPDGEIRQVQGKSYSRPETPVMEEFVKQLKSKGILNKRQKASSWKQRD